MSRYVCHFLANLSPQAVRSPLKMLFEACGMDTMYETDDYVMARETPGGVVFTKLVTCEVSIDLVDPTVETVKLSFLVKNEELPLNPNNHCRQVFELLQVAVAHNYDWEPVDNARQVAISELPAPEPIDRAATEPVCFDSADLSTTATTLNPVFN